LLRVFISEIVPCDKPITQRRIGVPSVHGDCRVNVSRPAGDINVVLVLQVEVTGERADDDERHTEVVTCPLKTFEDGGNALNLLVIGIDFDRHSWVMLC
jgi:hypothetical protein